MAHLLHLTIFKDGGLGQVFRQRRRVEKRKDAETTYSKAQSCRCKFVVAKQAVGCCMGGHSEKAPLVRYTWYTSVLFEGLGAPLINSVHPTHSSNTAILPCTHHRLDCRGWRHSPTTMLIGTNPCVVVGLATQGQLTC